LLAGMAVPFETLVQFKPSRPRSPAAAMAGERQIPPGQIRSFPVSWERYGAVMSAPTRTS
jgi:hypothetical protein